ncbi:MAG: hypothetical protein ACRDZY_10310, partial [Acidimicrobiales bacterium]
MSAPEAPPAPTPAPQPWAGPTPGSYRLGYEGPGVPIWRTRGAPAKRRDRWIWSVDHAGSLTLAALGIARALAYYGDPDGSRIRVSEARIAAEITMADGTVSRAICELEDAGYLQVRRSRWHRCPEDGQLAREVNHYTLTLPPSDAEARGIKGSRKRRPSSPTPRQNHQAAQERRDAERRQEVTAALAEALAGADADLEA